MGQQWSGAIFGCVGASIHIENGSSSAFLSRRHDALVRRHQQRLIHLRLSGSDQPALTNSTVPPIIASHTTSPFGISIEVIDGTDRVKSDSIKLTMDGAAVV